MRRVAALFIALAMMFAVGCQPPDAGGGGDTGDTDANTTSIETPSPSIEGEGVQLVSLKLPGMTWGGCAAAVRGKLADVPSIADIEADTDTQKCSFNVNLDEVDIAAKLDELAKTDDKFANWSVWE